MPLPLLPPPQVPPLDGGVGEGALQCADEVPHQPYYKEESHLSFAMSAMMSTIAKQTQDEDSRVHKK